MPKLKQNRQDWSGEDCILLQWLLGFRSAGASSMGLADHLRSLFVYAG
jgi:hypothetical protein